ncbi:Hypothetical predicted protein [Paramuricea clavata]|uniref:Uncharacterized protein n=1 Tax=Paramuricea clavata TaxID=317549 RepID=A0A7D9H739_PARCT|nr:Hypothetical predicted protein [Paramuricea clavata]
MVQPGQRQRHNFKINPGIFPDATRRRPRRSRQYGGTVAPPTGQKPPGLRIGDILQNAVASAVLKGQNVVKRKTRKVKSYTLERKKQVERMKERQRRGATQKGGRIASGGRKPINHMPVVYQYHQ